MGLKEDESEMRKGNDLYYSVFVCSNRMHGGNVFIMKFYKFMHKNIAIIK